jgi:hypothetical protein
MYNEVADITQCLTKPLALEQYGVLSDRLLRGLNGVPVTHKLNLYIPAKIRARNLEVKPEENL